MAQQQVAQRVKAGAVTMAPALTQAEQNRNVVRRFAEEFLAGANLEVADELVTEDCVLYHPLRDRPIGGREGLKAFVKLFWDAFPDLEIRVEDLVIENDRAVLLIEVQGTHQGDFMGIPATNRELRWKVSNIMHMSDGKIAQNTVCENTAEIFRGIGAYPVCGLYLE